jgi:hypothetical protein
VVGVDRSKMKLFDLDASAQQGISKMGDADAEEKEQGGFKTFRQRMEDKFVKKNFDDWS